MDGHADGGSKVPEVCTLLIPLGSTVSPKVYVCLLVGLWIQLGLVCDTPWWIDPLTMCFFLVCPRPRATGQLTMWQLSLNLEGEAEN